MPLSPSTSAVAGAVRVTVMLGRALKPLAFSRRTYCASRKMPWPSAPVRSASVISAAQRAASSPGNPAAARLSTIIERIARAGMCAKFSSANFPSTMVLLRHLPLLAQNLRRLAAKDDGAVGLGNIERLHEPHAVHH